MERGWVCRVGRGYVAVWRCHNGVGGAGGNAGVLLGEDIFSQRKVRQVSGMGGKFGERMWAREWSKAKVVRQMLTGSQVERRQGRVPKMVSGGS